MCSYYVGKHKCFSGDNCLCIKQHPKRQHGEQRKALKGLQNKALRGLGNK